jgi:hypothetical protein
MRFIALEHKGGFRDRHNVAVALCFRVFLGHSLRAASGT